MSVWMLVMAVYEIYYDKELMYVEKYWRIGETNTCEGT